MSYQSVNSSLIKHISNEFGCNLEELMMRWLFGQSSKLAEDQWGKKNGRVVIIGLSNNLLIMTNT